MTTTLTVPDEIADEVRRFAAFVLADRGIGDPTVTQTALVSTQTTDHIADYPLWADEDVIALANAGTSTAGYYRAIMDAIIAHGKAREWVSLDELATWTSIKRSVLSTFRTHLYRYVNSHLGDGSMAPFTGVSGADLRPARGREVFYRISQECAAQWMRIQSELNEVS